jgi:ribosomal protein S27E
MTTTDENPTTDAYGNKREFKRRVDIECAACENDEMGVLLELHEGSQLTLECPKCSHTTHIFSSDLPREDKS